MQAPQKRFHVKTPRSEAVQTAPDLDFLEEEALLDVTSASTLGSGGCGMHIKNDNFGCEKAAPERKKTTQVSAQPQHSMSASECILLSERM